MKRHHIRLTAEAKADLSEIFRIVRQGSGSDATARGYVRRIRAFLAGFETAPERGTVRDGERPGLRLIGFERRVTVAFVVTGDTVLVLRVLYAGQQLGGT